MKKAIYHALTVQNNIILNNEALEYLTSVVSVDDLPTVATELKKHRVSVFDLEKIKEVLLKSFEAKSARASAEAVEIRDVGFRRRDGMARFKFLREAISEKPMPIYMLKPGQEAVIFGAYHLDRLNNDVLEDDQGMVKLSFSACADEAFLHEDIFVGLKGALGEENTFVVTHVLHPQVRLEASAKRGHKPQYNFLVFNNFAWDAESVVKLRSVLASHPDMDLLVFTGNSGRNDRITEVLEAYKDITFVFTPSKRDFDLTFLPKKVDPGYANHNYRSVSNPFEMDVGDTRVGIVMDDVFGAKRNGRYIGVPSLESFVRTFLSQYSFNPFTKDNLSFTTHFDVLIVVQDAFSCITKQQGVCFVSLGCDDAPSFLKYNLGELSIAKL